MVIKGKMNKRIQNFKDLLISHFIRGENITNPTQILLITNDVNNMVDELVSGIRDEVKKDIGDAMNRHEGNRTHDMFFGR